MIIECVSHGQPMFFAGDPKNDGVEYVPRYICDFLIGLSSEYYRCRLNHERDTLSHSCDAIALEGFYRQK